MKAVILAGGEGTRLRPLTCNIPKVMVPVLNEPLVGRIMNYLISHGVDSSVLTVSYLPEVIEAHFGSGEGTGIKISYVLEEKPLGTAGAVKNVEKDLNETFLVLNGDILTDLDLEAMLRFHREKEAQITFFLTPVENPSAFGVVETDSDGRVLRFLEKPAPGETSSNWINGGIYIIEPQVLTHAPSGEFYMFETDLFPKLLGMGIPMYGYQARPYWIDLGTPRSYLKVHQDLLTENSIISWKESTDESYERSWIHPSAKVVGPVLLGTGCSIGPGALVRGPSVLGPGCVVGKDVTILESILWENVIVEFGAYLEECIIGDGVYIGEGARIGEGCILGDNIVISKGNHVDDGVVMWPEKLLEPKTISYH